MTRAVAASPVETTALDRLPPEITNSTRAVVWKYEGRNGKRTKVPYKPQRTAERAAVDDPTTWGSFSDARAAVEDGKADGAGVVLGSGLVGIDLDQCRDLETGAIESWALAIVDFINSYTEISPSRRGLHILVHGSLPPGPRRRGKIEMYAEGRYFTVTGNHVDGTPLMIEERTEQLARLHADTFTPEPAAKPRPVDLDDATLLNRARAARNGPKFCALWDGDASEYASQSEADLALCGILAFWTDKDAPRIDRMFRQSGLMRPKWDEHRRDSTYGERTISRAIAVCGETFSGGQEVGTNSNPPAVGRPSEHPKTPHSQATQVVNLAFRDGVELFRDADDTAYMDVPVPDHHEVHPLRSKRGRTWLAGRFFQETGKAAGAQALADALNVLEAHAFYAAVRPVGVRIVREKNAIYLDLGDDQWRVVEVTADGWRILSRSPVAFRRPKGLMPLPQPLRGASINELRPFLNVDDDDFVLIVAFILSCLRGYKPYPILMINGEHGSAKSSLTAIIRALVDPNAAPLRAEPTDPRDLMIAASNAHVLSFDNLSHVRLADDLARLATGSGFSTRTLYENREEEIFVAARPIILNGIPELASQPDLVSRSMFVTLPSISDEDRRDEAELWAAFGCARPRILGAVLDALAEALRRLPTVSLRRKPRMADIARWIVAAESACPWPKDRFLDVYDSNRRGAIDAVLEGDIVAATAEALAPWEGTATQFLEEINKRATDEQKKQRHWFRGPRQARDALKRIAPPLRETGIQVVFGEKDNTRRRNRIIRIERVVTSSSATSASSENRNSTVVVDGRTPDELNDASASSSAGLANTYELPDDADDADDSDATHSNREGSDDE